MRLLLVKMSSMGDILHTLPAITDAYQRINGLTIDWVIEEGFSEIATWHPAVQATIPIALRRWRKKWFSATHQQERRQFKQRLTACHYDKIIDAQGLLKSALVVQKAHGEKHGYDWHSAREPMAAFFYRHRHAVATSHHAVERIRQLFAQVLNYTLPTTQGDYGIATHFLPSAPTSHLPYLVFLHATTRPEKHWPEAAWRALIAKCVSNGHVIKLPWGAPHEYERACRLAAGFSQVEVLPKLSLAEMAKVIAHAQAVVSVDTGLSHLTAALDKTNITLYGPTDPGLIGGYGKHQQALCTESGNMADLSVEQVYQQLMTHL